ncbi:protein of unknown function [Algoriphagus locisalis]|uniref:DUF4221 domain-containing protein n=1 Tax=Algoriphagus locisalis TaxID=305507 RepID=A0A1I7ANJ9_9BACT|nr:DUF4221 family protein [Algoriphagus locisalis]SFT76436.1 protein of unknown function [Algoriphagus locisalis]
MKRLLTVSFLALLSACAGKEPESTEQKNILENLTYSVDTLVVDAGEDFLNLSRGLGEFGLSDDKKRLFFFESEPPKLVEVDLENLKVLKKTEFEVEGPDGIGSYLSGLEIGPTGNLYINSYATVGIFGQNGKKLQDLKFFPSGIDSALAENNRTLFSRAVYDFDSRKIYSQPTFQDAQDHILLILDPETQTAQSLPIPKMKIVDDYSGTFTIESGGSSMISFYAVASFFTFFPGELILSTGAMSSIYRYNIQTEELAFIDIQHQSVPNVMKIEIPKNTSDPKEASDIQNKIFEHINFMEMLWDESRQLYFRFGLKTFRGETKDDPTTFEYYLFAYDRDFKVLGETKLNTIEGLLSKTFFKDGKLYSYVNIDDELGFAVFTFDF